MKLIVSGEPLPPDVQAKFPQAGYAPCIDNQEAVDSQGWHQPRTLIESCRNRWALQNAALDSHAIVDQEDILQRALSGGLRPDEPGDIDRMIWCAKQIMLTGKKFFPGLQWSHWCSVVNPIYVPNETGAGVRAATAIDMVALSQQTAILRQACDVVECSVYPYYFPLQNGSELNEPWIKASTRAALKLAPQRLVMMTIGNRWTNMQRYSREFLTNLVKWIKAEYVMEGTRKDKVDIINLWHCDSYLYKIATGEVDVEWWPGHKQQCIDAFLSPGAPTPAQIIAEDLQTIVEALA